MAHWFPPFEEHDVDAMATAADVIAALLSVTRQLDAVKVCINDPECRAITERKIADARSVLMAAGIDPDGGA